ncbi:MAG TPA: hypothetical protein DEH22_14670 [Chloroflexi bacterium]|nr:hypothetical protein [Chloroflexota bacterium]
MRIIDLALNDLLQIFRDWKAALFMVVMPIGFTLMFGVIFGSSGGETDPRIPVILVDQDQGSLVTPFYEILSRSESVRPLYPEDDQTLETLTAQIDKGELAAIVVIPAGYSAALLAGEAPQLTVILNPQSSAGTTAQWAIQNAASRLTNVAQTAQFSAQARTALQPFADATAEQTYLEAGLSAAVTAWANPSISLKTAQTGQAQDAAAAVYSDNAFAQSSAGMMVQFAIAGLIGASEVLVLERKSGSLRRLLTTPMRRFEILLGHFLAMWVMIFMQFTLLIGFAQLVLDVPYSSAPLATLVMALATSIFAASLGLLIGALSKTADQVVIFSLIPMFILSGLGGAWMPLEFTSASFQKVAHFTPLAWAMDGFKNIIVRGQGLETVLLPAAVLLAFGALCFGVAVWRFRFEEA